MKINVQLIDFPVGSHSHESVTPNEDGSYTVFLNARDASNIQQQAYLHALKHIEDDDFYSSDSVQAIEAKTHGRPQIRKKKKLTKWERYHRKQLRKEKGLAKMGLMRESYIDDDEYGTPTVKYRVIKQRW